MNPMSRLPRQQVRKQQVLAIYEEFHRPEFIGLDPLVTLRRFSRPTDIEIAGCIAAVLSYGRVETIIRSIEEVFDRMSAGPRDFCTASTFREKKKCLRGFKHRFNDGDDLALLLQSIAGIVDAYGSVERFFTHALRNTPAGMRDALCGFSATVVDGARGWQRELPRSFRFLAASPRQGGACKRWNMYLRWMVRPADGIDLGVWRRVHPSQLMMPVDTHIATVAGRIGLTGRKTADWRMAEEITAGLRLIDPEDPVRFDFSLCRSGMMAVRKAAA